MALYERTPFDTPNSMGRPIQDPRAGAYAQILQALAGGGGTTTGGYPGMAPPPPMAADKNQDFIRRQLAQEIIQQQRSTPTPVHRLDQRTGPGQISIVDVPGYNKAPPMGFADGNVRPEAQAVEEARAKALAEEFAQSLVRDKLALEQDKVNKDFALGQGKNKTEDFRAETAADLGRRQLDLEAEKLRMGNGPQAEALEAESKGRVLQFLQSLPGGAEGLNTGQFDQAFADALKRQLPFLTAREQQIAREIIESGGFTKSADMGLREYLHGAVAWPLVAGLDALDVFKDEAPLLDERKVRSPLERLYYAIMGE